MDKIKRFIKENDGLVVEAVLSKHAGTRLAQRMGVPYESLNERYGDPPLIKLRIDSATTTFSDGGDNHGPAMIIQEGHAKFILCTTPPKSEHEWIVVTFYWRF